MNASMVRFGGIAVFAGIALGIILPFLLAGSGVGRFILSLIQTAIILFVLWTTKGFMNAKGYKKADIPLLIVMAVTLLLFVVGLIFSTQAGLGTIMSGRMAAAGLIGIVILIVSLLMLGSWLWFAFLAIGFGKSGGGIWKAIGILYLVAFGLFLVIAIIGALAGGSGSAAAMGGAAIGGGILALIGLLVFLGAVICHGIGLILGAGKMGT
ncbi:MAG: hypothetical protein O7I42_16355 [Alphaproteobacteria bacterium]|nr:hypothetical protein [Alphaproteobacteria bacterium]